MNPVSPDSTQPAMNASVRNSPDWANERPDEPPLEVLRRRLDNLGRRHEHDDRERDEDDARWS